MQLDEIDYGNLVNIYSALVRECRITMSVDEFIDNNEIKSMAFYYLAIMEENVLIKIKVNN